MIMSTDFNQRLLTGDRVLAQANQWNSSGKVAEYYTIIIIGCNSHFYVVVSVNFGHHRIVSITFVCIACLLLSSNLQAIARPMPCKKHIFTSHTHARTSEYKYGEHQVKVTVLDSSRLELDARVRSGTTNGIVRISSTFFCRCCRHLFFDSNKYCVDFK